MKRLFIGIPFNDEIKNKIADQIVELKNKDTIKHQEKNFRWVPKENYHITLEFLGSISDDLIPNIQSSLHSVVQTIKPFKISIENLLFLPSMPHPHVIAFNVKLSEELAKLYAAIHGAMSLLELKLEERPYLPHVTLARIKSFQNKFPIIQIPSCSLQFSVNEVSLFETLSSNNNSTYHIIRSEQLKN